MEKERPTKQTSQISFLSCEDVLTKNKIQVIKEESLAREVMIDNVN